MKTQKIICALIILLSAYIQLNAATFTVTNTTDADPGSLRAAINSANALAGADTIVFDSMVFASLQTITLASYLPIYTDLVILGPGADFLAISGNNATRIFVDDNNSMNDIVISGLELKNANNVSDGSAVFIAGAHLTIRYCNIHNNSTGNYGNITVWGPTVTSSLTIENSSIHHNTTAGNAAGIFMSDGASLTIFNSTIYSNTGPANAQGQAIFGWGPHVSLVNVTIAGHSAGFSTIHLNENVFANYDSASLSVRNCIFDNSIRNFSGQLATSAISNGHNISSDDDMSFFLTAAGDMNNTSALLDPAGLQDNGGTTPTVALQCGSPALNAGTNFLSTDQIGNARGGIADIGAYESTIIPTAYAGPNAMSCRNSSYNLIHQNATASTANISWSTSGNGSFMYIPNQTSLQPIYLPSNNDFANGSVVLTLTVADSNSFCDTSVTSSFTLHFCTLLVAAINGVNGGNNVTMCSSAGSITFSNALATGDIDWGSSGDGTFNNEEIQNPTYTPGPNDIAAGQVTIFLSVSNDCGVNECHENAVARLHISQPAALPTIVENGVLCPGGSTTLTAGSGYSSYLWSTGATSQSTSVSTGGIYEVTVTNGACSASGSFMVFPGQLPVPSISGSNIVCAGNTTTLDAGSFTGFTVYLWSTGATSQTISASAAGTYTVTVTNNAGCTASVSRTLPAIPPAINVDAGPNKFVYKGYADSSCTTLQSTISGGTPPLTRVWSKNGSPSLGNGSTLNVCPTVPTVYYLLVTDANGCTARDSVKVCVFDVRCGSGNKKVIVCHGTGSVTNPFQTLCILPADAYWHFLNHPGEKLGTCGMVKACTFPNPGRLDEDEVVIEEGAEFLGAFPNPFSSTTTIRFTLPTDDVVSVKIFDVMGRVVENIYDGKISAGEIYSTEFDGSRFSKGIYFLVLNAQSGLTQSSKMVLDK